MTMELVIYNPTEEQLLQSYEIMFNNEDLKKELATRLVKYQGLVYSEANIKEAKADRATLNKFKEAIENKRKEIKKACLQPYESFETKIKEIVAMIDQPIQAIDAQVKNYEQVKRDEKQQAIKQFYTDKVADLADLVPFDRVFNQKWLNATYKEADIHKEITDLFIKVEDDLKVIGDLNSEYEAQGKDAYLKTFDLTVALQEMKRLEEQAAKLAEYNRQQAEKKRQAAEAKSQPEAIKPQPSPETKVVNKPEMSIKPNPEQVQIIDFRVEATQDQLNALKQFLLTNGIKYGRVPTAGPERKAM